MAHKQQQNSDKSSVGDTATSWVRLLSCGHWQTFDKSELHPLRKRTRYPDRCDACAIGHQREKNRRNAKRRRAKMRDPEYVPKTKQHYPTRAKPTNKTARITISDCQNVYGGKWERLICKIGGGDLIIAGLR